MMFSTASLKIICMLFVAPYRTNCVIWKTYKRVEAFADKMCSTSFVEGELVVPSQLKCLGTCSAAPKCKAIIYHKNNKTCYSLKKGYDLDDWSAEFAGAKMYIKASCPKGWTFVYRACFRLTVGEHTRNNMTTICKSLDIKANLADLYTWRERDSVALWVLNELLRAEYDRLRSRRALVKVWCDLSQRKDDNYNCIGLYYKPSKGKNWRHCSREYLHGLCRLDVQ